MPIFLRLLIISFLLILIDVYAFQAFKTSVKDSPILIRRIVYVLYGLISLSSIIFLVVMLNISPNYWQKPWFIYWRAFATIAYFCKLPIALFVGFDDIRRLFLWGYSFFTTQPVDMKSRSKFLNTIGILVGTAPLIALTYGMIRNMYRFKIMRQTVRLENLPTELKGLKIIQISDIHSGTYTDKKPLYRAIELINNENPDLVFFTGDLVNALHTEMDNYLDVFDKIKAKYGVYSTFGNHDFGDYIFGASAETKKAHLLEMEKIHERLGWNLLRNENRILEIAGKTVAVIGVDNFSAKLHFPRYGKLDEAYRGAESAAVKLLLSHDPSHWRYEIVKDFKAIDITFAGHTHGFQFGIEIPGFFRWSPSKYMYPEWAGLYQEAKQYLYVNRGLGCLGYPGRVGILPEITVMTLA